MDLVVSRAAVRNIRRVESYAAAASDHYLIAFTVTMAVEIEQRKRRITKTLLQSYVIKEKANMYYEVALKEVVQKLDNVVKNT